MSKKVISVLLALTFLFAVFSTAVYAEDVEVDIVGAYGSCGDELLWTLDKYGLLTISGEGEMYDYYDGEAPWLEYDVKELIVEEGVTYIGTYSFASCMSLETAVILADLDGVGDYAFNNCIALNSINFNGMLGYVGEYVFENCYSLNSIVLPNMVESVGEGAFSYCAGLKNVSLGSFIMFIGYRTFYECDSLVNFTIADAVTYIGEEAFANCDKIAKVIVPDTMDFIDDTAFDGCGSSLMLISAKGSVAEEYAFNKGIAFGEKVVDDSVIENGICGDAIEWTLGSDGILSITGFGDMFDFSDSPWQNFEINTVVIEEGVTSIGATAFAGCVTIENVTLPSTITKIGEGAFESCEALVAINLPAELTEIGGSAFYGCASIKEVVIPDSVVTIGAMAFSDCISLESVKLSAKVETIEEYAFLNCQGVKEITIPETAKYIGYCAFGYYDGSDKTVAGFKVTGVKGSEAEIYAVDNGFEFVEMEIAPPVVKPDANSKYYMDDATKTMPKVVDKTNKATLIAALAEYGMTADVVKADGSALKDSDYVGTGCKVSDGLGNTYVVVVRGDTDGSGVIDTTDYLRIKGHCLGNLVLEGIYFNAADTDNGGSVDSTDYLQIKRYFLGKFDLYA